MRISDWSSDVFSSDLLVGAALVFLDGRLADAAGRAGDQADLVVESVHWEFPCGCTWIMARVGAGGHCLFVRCRAWRGRRVHLPGAESSIDGSPTGTPPALQAPAPPSCPRTAGVASTRTCYTHGRAPCEENVCQ